MTDRIELHQPTKSECAPRHEKLSPSVVIPAELKTMLPKP